MNNNDKAAHDDLFVSMILFAACVFATNRNWLESDWWGLFGTVVGATLCVLWFSLRVYHLTRKDETFQESDDLESSRKRFQDLED